MDRMLVHAISSFLDVLGVSHIDKGWNFKAPASLLGSERSCDRNTQSDDCSRNAHDWTIGFCPFTIRCFDEVRFGDRIYDLSRGRRDHVAELVGDTWEGRAESGGCEFIKMNGNDTPSTLYEELHHETRSREGAFALGKDPSWDETHADY